MGRLLGGFNSWKTIVNELIIDKPVKSERELEGGSYLVEKTNRKCSLVGWNSNR